MAGLDSPSIVQLPGGGVARLRDPKDLTVRFTRPLSIIVTALGPDVLQAIMDANTTQEVEAAETGEENGPEAFSRLISELGLDYRQAELLVQMNDATIYKWWSGCAGPKKYPLPNSPLDVPNLPEDVYHALLMATGKREAEWRITQSNPYGVSQQNVEDLESPTGASGA